jgi:hypothetical protein
MRRGDVMAQTLTDHDSIRRWADKTGARPARVKGTGDDDDPGLLRLDFEGYSGEDSLDEISWSDWFRKFDDSQLALIVDDSGRKPNFNKLVRRPDDDGGQAGRRRAAAAEDEEEEDATDEVDELDEDADEDEDEEFEDEDEEEEDEVDDAETDEKR